MPLGAAGCSVTVSIVHFVKWPFPRDLILLASPPQAGSSVLSSGMKHGDGGPTNDGKGWRTLLQNPAPARAFAAVESVTKDRAAVQLRATNDLT